MKLCFDCFCLHSIQSSNTLAKLTTTFMYHKYSNKCPGIYFNTWQSGENGWAIIRGYIPEICETKDFPFQRVTILFKPGSLSAFDGSFPEKFS